MPIDPSGAALGAKTKVSMFLERALILLQGDSWYNAASRSER